MATVKRWWQAWGGHVYTAGAIILIAVTVFTVWITVTTLDTDVMFYSFVIGMLCLLLAICLGIMGSHRFQTKVQRRYILNTDANLERLEPPGRHDRKRERQYPLPKYSPVPEAHSVDEDDS
jgi:hypothetical protein